jgi:hypothetical protein
VSNLLPADAVVSNESLHEDRFVGLTTLEGHLITPTIVGRRVTLNLVFLALVFWTWLLAANPGLSGDSAVNRRTGDLQSPFSNG